MLCQLSHNLDCTFRLPAPFVYPSGVPQQGGHALLLFSSVPKGCAGHATAPPGLPWLLQSAGVWLHTYPCARAALGLARLAPLPLPPTCQGMSEGGQRGNRVWGNREYPSWGLNSIHLHAAAPELQASRQGAGGRDGTPMLLCAGCRAHDVARKGPMCPCACEFFTARSRAPEPSKEKPCLSYSSYKAALGHCQYLV